MIHDENRKIRAIPASFVVIGNEHPDARLERKVIPPHPAISSKAVATVREYYGHPALSGNVIKIPKLRLQILTPHSKTQTGLTFDAPARALSVARRNERPDVGLECKAFPPNSSNILQKLRQFLK
ncbi:hypothetical protein TNCV_4362381 [Trichonephila clavipes]|nr:hypothetical protein TNCV_4362381 [Trichonephila clavipes]